MSTDNNTISLEFKTPNGNSYFVKDLYEEDSVEFIKQKIQDASGIPPEQMRLIHNGKKLEDHYTISDYKLINSTTVRLVVAVR